MYRITFHLLECLEQQESTLTGGDEIVLRFNGIRVLTRSMRTAHIAWGQRGGGTSDFKYAHKDFESAEMTFWLEEQDESIRPDQSELREISAPTTLGAGQATFYLDGGGKYLLMFEVAEAGEEAAEDEDAAGPCDGSATIDNPVAGCPSGGPADASASDEDAALGDGSPDSESSDADDESDESTGDEEEEEEKQLSGSYWVTWADTNCPNSTSLDDLESPFKENAKAFIEALRDAGATVSISATFRPKRRAYLFHWSWKIYKEKCAPSDPTEMDGVPIEWDHGDDAASKDGAKEMVDGFDLSLTSQYAPALSSNHTRGQAVDMDISWSGDLTIKNKDGSEVTITTSPRNGQNTDLHTVGETYSVHKLVNDPPHWSDDGN